MKKRRGPPQQERTTGKGTLLKWISICCAVTLTFFLTVLATAAIVRSAYIGGHILSRNQSRLTMSIAEFPALIHDALVELSSQYSQDPTHLLLNKGNDAEYSSWVRKFPEPSDDGYLLLSGVDPKSKQSQVTLIRIADGHSIATWAPDWPTIYRMAGLSRSEIGHAQAIHPLLQDNGDIVFNTMGALLVRLSPCSSMPTWVLHMGASHSNERDSTGNIWTVASDENLVEFPQAKQLREPFTDNLLLLISPGGQVIRTFSFSKILHDNGMDALLFGTAGDRPNPDQLHINEVQPAYSASKYWEVGDLLISARNLSTVFLFRPSSGKILWHQTGPWLNQHSAQFVDGHRISVFDNHAVPMSPTAFLTPLDLNHVVVHDFDTGADSEPFSKLLEESRPITPTEGRAQLLPDGGLFLEETDRGRILRFTKDRLLWSFVNEYDSGRVGLVAWSRYLTPEEAQRTLTSLRTGTCH